MAACEDLTRGPDRELEYCTKRALYAPISAQEGPDSENSLKQRDEECRTDDGCAVPLSTSRVHSKLEAVRVGVENRCIVTTMIYSMEYVFMWDERGSTMDRDMVCPNVNLK